jgi:hypothetical protein
MAAGCCQKARAMSVVYSLYDALVSINVPTEKAKAVLDAMERDMFAQLVTRNEFNAEMKLIRQELASGLGLMSRDMQAFKSDFEHRLASMESRLTVKMGTIAGIWTGVLFGLLKLA